MTLVLCVAFVLGQSGKEITVIACYVVMVIKKIAIISAGIVAVSILNVGPVSARKLERCTVSRKGRVTCTYQSYGPKVWNNGKARGYYWPKR